MFFLLAACAPDRGPPIDDAPSVTLTAPEPSTGFGAALATGDFSGDGTDDVVVSAGLADGGSAVWVFPGTSDGLFPVPSSELTGVTGALAVGDFDRDGFDDLVVGTRVYRGSLDGLGPEASTTVVPGSDEPEWQGGFAAVGAADIDGDGFDDAVFSAYDGYDGGGSVQVFRGGRRGLSREMWDGEAIPSWASLAGDTDGDGCDDSILDRGLHRGSSAGLVPEMTAWGMDVGVGDVNGDGLADVMGQEIIDGDAGPCASGYCVFSFVRVARDGRLTPPSMLMPIHDFIGTASGVGDVDGDGYDDVLVSEPYHGVTTDPGSDATAVPRAYLYRGSHDGLALTPAVTLTGPDVEVGTFGARVIGGDVNGDGLSDVILGSGDAQRVRVYYGSAL